MPEKEKAGSVGVSMPARLIAELDQEAKAEGLDFSTYVVKVIELGRRNRHARS